MRAKFTLSPNQIKNLENHGIYPEAKTITPFQKLEAKYIKNRVYKPISGAERIGYIISNGITCLMGGIFLYAILTIIIQLITKF